MSNENIRTEQFDAVIIGAGGAGMRASLQMAQSGYKVAVISKVYPTRSHTVSAQGGIAAALGNVVPDKWEWHMYDTIMGSDCLADKDAAEYMCEQAPASVIELEHMGLPFSRLDDGKIYQRAFGGHTRDFGGELARRTCAASDRTGHAMLHTLYQKNIEANTHFFNEWLAIDLVKSEEGGVSGVVATCMETGENVYFKARVVALATGGAGRIFETTTNAYTNTGDGIGMVLRAGFQVQDMEFWQFHPTGLAGVGALITEGCRGEGGYLLNGLGERFMERYSPHLKDLDCRDIVSRSSIIEILEGRGAGPNKDYVLLKLDHLGEKVLNERLPGILELSRKFMNIDPVKESIPVVPTCHYQMGGIPTTIHGQVITRVKGKDEIIEGLFAAGECACVSVHGANRLGTNSLLDLVVFGRAIGLHLEAELKAGLHHRAEADGEMDRAIARYNRWNNTSNTENPYEIRTQMKKIMQNNFGVFRDGEHMKKGLRELKELSARLKKAKLSDYGHAFNTTRIEMFELDNMMETALATAILAEQRKESRGAHARYDFPERDDKHWLKHSVYFANGELDFRPVNMQPKNVPPIPLKLRE